MRRAFSKGRMPGDRISSRAEDIKFLQCESLRWLSKIGSKLLSLASESNGYKRSYGGMLPSANRAIGETCGPSRKGIPIIDAFQASGESVGTRRTGRCRPLRSREYRGADPIRLETGRNSFVRRKHIRFPERTERSLLRHLGGPESHDPAWRESAPGPQ